MERSRARLGALGGVLLSVAACGVDRSPDPPLGTATQPLLMAIELAELIPDMPEGDGNFGISTALEGDVAVVGMRRVHPFTGGRGGAYVFLRQGALWSQQAALKAWNSQPYDDNFGVSVAIRAGTIAVGAPGDLPTDSGRVLTFVQSGATWVDDAEIKASDGLESRDLGRSLALSGDTLLVGDGGSDTAGAAYVFVRSGGVWSQEARLVAANEVSFGTAVALSGDTAAVRAASGVYVFVRAAGAWSQQAKLDVQATNLTLDGDTLLLGGHYPKVFTRTGGAWNMEAELPPPQSVGWEDFGVTVALDGDRALVGTGLEAVTDSRFAYVFRRQSGVWAAEATAAVKPKFPYACLGCAVAISGDKLLLGAPGESAPNLSSGAVFALQLVPGLAGDAPCTQPASCASGFCSDGVCCDALCAGTCMACSAAKKGGGTDGVCEPIAAGTDPDDECVARPAASCGTTGVCDGKGACQRYPDGTPCDDGDACTSGEVCAQGACTGKRRACDPPDACHLPGVCDGQTGECVYALANPSDPVCNGGGCGCAIPGGEPRPDARWLLCLLAALALGRSRVVSARGA